MDDIYKCDIPELYGWTHDLTANREWHDVSLGSIVAEVIEEQLGFTGVMIGNIDGCLFMKHYMVHWRSLYELIEDLARTAGAVWWFEPRLDEYGYYFHFRALPQERLQREAGMWYEDTFGKEFRTR